MDLLPDNGAEGPDGEADIQADSDYGSYYPHHMEDHDGYLEPLEKRSASFFSSTPADLEMEGTSPPLMEDQQVSLSELIRVSQNLVLQSCNVCFYVASILVQCSTKVFSYTDLALINKNLNIQITK
jgi:hypothetical protein